jgi:hypothetical protein
MSDLIEKIVNQIDSASTPADLDGCAWIAGDLLRKANSKNYRSGFEEIDREEVSEADGQRIQNALLGALRRNSETRFVSSILSALSCSTDKSLIPLYQEILAEHMRKLKGSNGVVYSALHGLDALGESVFDTNPEGGSSQCLADVDKTIRQAHKYLQTLGIMDPW